MIIHVGSKNSTKIKAIEDAVKLYPKIFRNARVIGIDVEIDQFGHPKSIEQTVNGAIERAKMAFGKCDYSVGIEGGLMQVPMTCSGYMEIGVCALFDGKNHFLGISPAFEWPKNVTDMIHEGSADASLAFKKLGYTDHEKLGAEKGGIIGFLTNNRFTREQYTLASFIMAVIHLEKREYYTK